MNERWTYELIKDEEGRGVAIRIILEDADDADAYAAEELNSAGLTAVTNRAGTQLAGESEALAALGSLIRGDDEPGDVLDRSQERLRRKVSPAPRRAD
jgi:predicted amidohydrolase YtcJ